MMSDLTNAASVIEHTLKAIADDEVGSLVGNALQAAWMGQRFDEDALRKQFAALADAEAAAS